jgi:hypothetical protein
MQQLKFLIGADPELFVKDIYTREFVSAHDLIPGTKSDPFFVDGGAIQVDGVATEFNINPSATKEEFINNIFKVTGELFKRIEGDVNTQLHLVYQPTAIFNKNYFDSLPAEAKLLGCEPDYDAYTGEVNIPPETDKPFRTAGGHIHCGWGSNIDIYDPDHIADCCDLVKQLDTLLYPASLTWDSDDSRRQLYGKKGSFRPKHYGVEYRPLSCAWLESVERQEFVYDTTVFAMDLLFNKKTKVF